MNTAGLVGGIAAYRDRRRDGSYPSILINSIDMKTMLDLIGADHLSEVTNYLVGEVEKLARAGATFALLASNTPHIVFDAIRQEASLPMISIVEATCAAAQRLGLRRVGLFGTRFTMQGRFYGEIFSRQGITVIVPQPEEQEYIHGKYMGELVNGVFLPETRGRMLEIADRLRVREGIDGLVLGGTELPLLLHDAGTGEFSFLDTTKIHAECAVTEMLS
jgi:aspartate racemase